MATTTQTTQSRAQEFAGKALSDLSNAQRSQLTGQGRMIAALLFAHQEDFFAGAVSPGGATVDLSKIHEQLTAGMAKQRLEVTERTNFILGHLFNVMEYEATESAGQKWRLRDEWTQPQLIAFRTALRRVVPTVAHLIQGAGDGPVIQSEYSDKEMLATGAAAAIIPSGPQAGRLKVRQDLAVPKTTLQKAQEAGQDLSKHPPILLDGTRERTVEALARVAKERLGLTQPAVENSQDRALGHVALALQIVQRQFAKVEGDPEKVRETFPAGVIADARATCLVLIHSLFVDPNTPSVVDTDAIEREFTQFLDLKRAA